MPPQDGETTIEPAGVDTSAQVTPVVAEPQGQAATDVAAPARTYETFRKEAWWDKVPKDAADWLDEHYKGVSAKASLRATLDKYAQAAEAPADPTKSEAYTKLAGDFEALRTEHASLRESLMVDGKTAEQWREEANDRAHDVRVERIRNRYPDIHEDFTDAGESVPPDKRFGGAYTVFSQLLAALPDSLTAEEYDVAEAKAAAMARATMRGPAEMPASTRASGHRTGGRGANTAPVLGYEDLIDSLKDKG